MNWWAYFFGAFALLNLVQSVVALRRHDEREAQFLLFGVVWCLCAALSSAMSRWNILFDVLALAAILAGWFCRSRNIHLLRLSRSSD